MDASEISGIVSGLRANFNNDCLMPLAERDRQLDGLARMLTEHQESFEQALHKDLGKSAFVSFMTEIAIVQREIAHARKKLSAWAAPQKVSVPLNLKPAKGYIQMQPLGVVLIITPWNYPIQLSLVPLVGAIAAGNCVVLKPSEIASATSSLLGNLVNQYVSPEVVRVVEGDVSVTTVLLDQKFDHIFFTGSTKVGKIVQAAAGKQGASFTLELGGKCPCIVDKKVNLATAAGNILWGKFLNVGQDCIAPDYVLVHKSMEKQLLEEMKKTLLQFYGNDPKSSPDYGRIINQAHYMRLIRFLQGNGTIVTGGETSEADRYIAPTILSDVPRNAMIMNPDEEIFGPILPVLPVEDISDAVEFIRSRPHPLAIYLFSSDKCAIKHVTEKTRSGAVSMNTTILHSSVSTLPFGGIGTSGYGKYHGKFSFDVFSHQRALFNKKPVRPDLSAWLTHPPYSEMKRKILKLLLK